MRKDLLRAIGTWTLLLFFILMSYTRMEAFVLEEALDALIKKHYKCQYHKPDSAVFYLHQAFDIAKKDVNKTLHLHTTLAWYYANRQVNLDSSLASINRATDLLAEADDPLLIARAMTYRGYIHNRKKDFKNAILWQEKAIELKLRLQDSAAITYSYNLLANNYRNLANSSKKLGHDYKNEVLYESALSYYAKALSYCNNKRCTALVGKNLGLTYLQMKDYPTAQNYFEESIRIYKSLDHKKGEILSRVKLGVLYSETGHYQKALEQFFIAEQFYQEKEKRKNTVPLLRNMARVYLRLGQLDKAVEHAMRSLKVSKSRKENHAQLETTALLVEIFAQQKEFESAHKYQQEYQSLKDTFSYHEIKEELLNQNLIKEINANKIKLQLAEQDKIIIAQKSKNLWLGIVLMIVSGILFAILGVYFYQKRVEKLGQQIKAESHKRTLISQALEEERKISKQLQTEVEQHIKQLSEMGEHNGAQKNLEARESLYQIRLLTDEDWTEFKRLFLNVNPNFFDKFKKENPNISVGDLKVAALARLNFNNAEMGKMMAISTESVRKARYRLRQKLKLEDNRALQSYIFSL